MKRDRSRKNASTNRPFDVPFPLNALVVGKTLDVLALNMQFLPSIWDWHCNKGGLEHFYLNIAKKLKLSTNIYACYIITIRYICLVQESCRVFNVYALNPNGQDFLNKKYKNIFILILHRRLCTGCPNIYSSVYFCHFL